MLALTRTESELALSSPPSRRHDASLQGNICCAKESFKECPSGCSMGQKPCPNHPRVGGHSKIRVADISRSVVGITANLKTRMLRPRQPRSASPQLGSATWVSTSRVRDSKYQHGATSHRAAITADHVAECRHGPKDQHKRLWLCGSTRKDIARRTEISPAGEHHVEKNTTWEECDEAKGLGGDVRIQSCQVLDSQEFSSRNPTRPAIHTRFLLANFGSHSALRCKGSLQLQH